MAIVETKTITRPNTNVPFQGDSGQPEVTASIARGAPFHTSGNVVATNNLSGDGLNLSIVRTFDTLSTWSQWETLTITTALDKEIDLYQTTNGIGAFKYSLSGIDQPFTCTTTYTFPSSGLASHDALSRLISNQSSSNTKLTNVTVLDTSIVCVHTYTDSTDFTTNYWNDYGYCSDLATDGVTRTIEYAYVS